MAKRRKSCRGFPSPRSGVVSRICDTQNRASPNRTGPGVVQFSWQDAQGAHGRPNRITQLPQCKCPTRSLLKTGIVVCTRPCWRTKKKRWEIRKSADAPWQHRQTSQGRQALNRSVLVSREHRICHRDLPQTGLPGLFV